MYKKILSIGQAITYLAAFLAILAVGFHGIGFFSNANANFTLLKAKDNELHNGQVRLEKEIQRVQILLEKGQARLEKEIHNGQVRLEKKIDLILALKDIKGK